jgi:hypothetical protein
VAFFTNIIHRFEVPNSIITDNGTQFTSRKFLDFCEDHHIWVDWAATDLQRPQQIRQAMDEGTPLGGLESENDAKPSHGFHVVFLVYGAEAVLPTDLEYGSPRTRAYDDRSNRTNREDSLDQLEEARDMALLHSARYQQSLRRYHARGVRSRNL